MSGRWRGAGPAGLAAAAMVALPGAAAGNPLDAFGFGARGVALGGAVVATARDVSAGYYNPAGLAAAERLRLDLGYTYTKPALRLDGQDVDVDRASGFQGGLLLPGELFGRRVAFSVLVHLPDDRITRLRALRQSQPRFELYDNRPQRIVITSSAAVQLVGDLYFGAGVTYLSNTHGVLDVEGTVHATDASRTRLRSAVDVDLEAVRYPSFGLMFRPGQRWRFGLAEREAFSLALDLDVDVHGRVVTGPTDTTLVEQGRFFLNSTNNNLFSPRQVVAGLAYEGSLASVSLDVAWLQWSGFPASTARIDLDLSLDPIPFTLPVPDRPLAPHFHDIVVPRLGLEVPVIDTPSFALAVRSGAFYEPSPAPEQRDLTNYLDADKLGLAAGLGFRFGAEPGSRTPDAARDALWPAPLLLDVSSHWIHLFERRFQKSDPANGVGDLVADGEVPGLSVTLGVQL